MPRHALIKPSPILVLLLAVALMQTACRSASSQPPPITPAEYHPSLREGVYYHSFVPVPNGNEIFILLNNGQYRIVYRGGVSGREYSDIAGDYSLGLRDDTFYAGYLRLERPNNDTISLQLVKFNPHRWTISRMMRIVGWNADPAQQKPSRFKDFQFIESVNAAELMKLPRNEIEARLEQLAREAGMYRKEAGVSSAQD